ncbi:MAG TPA: tetratricopeptide repeat protein [Blastocatellia bacterium]|nr:tetratricopeptide repeat protein [Blastocatellia bacterium]
MGNRKILFGLVGLALGFIVSFMWTRDFNSRNVAAGPPVSDSMSRPSGAGAGAGGQQAMMANVRETLKKATENPKDYDAQAAAAQLYYQIGRTSEAAEFMKKAYEINAVAAAKDGIPAVLGGLYHGEGNYKDAETWFRRALESNPDDPEVLTELGATLAEKEPPEVDKGVQYLEAALKSNPKSGHAMMHMTQIFLMKSDVKKTEEWLTRFKATDPTNQNIPRFESQLESLKSGKPVNIPKE